MMKQLCLFLLLGCCVGNSGAQDSLFRKDYEEFHRKAIDEYSGFRDRINREYADFMAKAWKEFAAQPVIAMPPDEKTPPQRMPDEDRETAPEDRPVEIDTVLTTPVVRPQPVPPVPIREHEEEEDERFTTTFFGTEMTVRLGERHRPALSDREENTISEEWKRLSGTLYNNVLRDCLELRMRHRLCDWAYLLFLQKLAEDFCGAETDEAVFLTAFLYAQSGYKMRMACSDNGLWMLYASEHLIYGHTYFRIENEDYYLLKPSVASGPDGKGKKDVPDKLRICSASYPGEQALSLFIPAEPLLAESALPYRELRSEALPDMELSVSVNKNLLNFFSTYPTSLWHDDVCSRWAMYAETPLDEHISRQLYPPLRELISGKSQKESAELLLRFVQTAFVYEYDDNVWGGDRAFFAEETLHYPYSDCEDRSILYTRLIRDLLGLKTLLVYYPGHLATAVCFTEAVSGDYIEWSRKESDTSVPTERYIVCDPTYIGAPVGVSMPDMNNSTAKVILLR